MQKSEFEKRSTNAHVAPYQEQADYGRDLRMRTKQFALRIIRLCGSLPDTTVGRTIGRQVLRSGTSVGANYREAQRARSRAEFASKIQIVLQELDETAYWL